MKFAEQDPLGVVQHLTNFQMKLFREKKVMDFLNKKLTKFKIWQKFCYKFCLLIDFCVISIVFSKNRSFQGKA